MANKIMYINNKKATIDGSWLMLDPGLRVLTLHTVGNGTVTATKLSGYPGETAIITPTYETYNRFSGYELSGAGSIQNNVYTFGNENADLSAVFKPNAFTAVGLWEKGSDVNVFGNGAQATGSIPAKYAYLTAYTGDVLNEWHSDSERWNPSNISAYSITLNPKASIYLNDDNGSYSTATIYTNIGGNNTNSQTWTTGRNGGESTLNGYYDKTITTSTQSMYYIAGSLTARGYTNGYHYAFKATANYNSTGTTGSWTATGYAP